jgi:AcrR family transcriptional regulator
VVSAALAVADELGLHSLTIRAVARQVSAPPMSLYTHFSNKDELLDLMYSGIVRHLYQDEGNTTWQAELTAVCRRIYATFLEHPNWMPLLSRRATPIDVPLRERILSMMATDGIDPEFGFGILSSSSLATTGLVIAQLTYLDEAGQSSLSQRYQVLREAGASVVAAPLTRAAVSVKQEFHMREIFERTLTALVRGFEVMARDARIAT